MIRKPTNKFSGGVAALACVLSMSALAADPASVTANTIKGENLGKGNVSRILNADGTAVQKMMLGGTINPQGNGLTSGGIKTEVDDTKNIKCEYRSSLDSNDLIYTGYAGNMKIYCFTPNRVNYYVYACPVSIVGERCDAGSWYLLGGNKPLPDVLKGITTGSTDVIENLNASVLTCAGLECSVNVKYTRTTVINAATMSEDGESYLARRMADPKSMEASLMGDSQAKQKGKASAEQIQSRYTSCIEQNVSKLGTGNDLNTCDQTEAVTDPVNCLQTTTCAELKPAPKSTKSCNVDVKYKDVEKVSWSFPQDAYGQCAKLNEYTKHCLDSYQYVQRVDTPETGTRQVTAYGSSCPAIKDKNGKIIGYNSPCTVTQTYTYYSYHDYVATEYPNSCTYSGPGISFQCGDAITTVQQWNAAAFIEMMGRLPTYSEMNELDRIYKEQVEGGGISMQEAVMAWKGVHPTIYQAFRNLTGRDPNQTEQDALTDAYAQWGDKAYATLVSSSAFDGTLLYNYSKATGCFALDRKLNDTVLAQEIYRYAVQGDMTTIMEKLAEYAAN